MCPSEGDLHSAELGDDFGAHELDGLHDGLVGDLVGVHEAQQEIDTGVDVLLAHLDAVVRRAEHTRAGLREVLEVAAAANKVRSRTFDQRSLDETAAMELRLPIEKLKGCLGEMGRAAGSPWRADEKAAATAAWLALATYSRK